MKVVMNKYEVIDLTDNVVNDMFLSLREDMKKMCEELNRKL